VRSPIDGIAGFATAQVGDLAYFPARFCKGALYGRSGAWVKVRANRGQELVIGGYIPGSTTFDSILIGHYEGRDLMYVGRIRNGFTPASRQRVFSKFEGQSISKCPFQNLPESGKGRWGEGLTAEDMKRFSQAA
jgi:bifunctional non-homologous end joining protein LigD